jgi:hypothetical protein
MVPLLAANLQIEDEGVWRDAFNFFQSNLRAHVEQKIAFCIALVFYGVHWNLIYLKKVELYLHVL